MPDRSIAQAVADLIVRMRWAIVLIWLTGVGALMWFVPPVDPSADTRTSFLPDQMPSRIAARALAKHFPGNSGLSAAVVVFERSEKLTRADRKVIEAIAARIRRPVAGLTTPSDLKDVHVRSPWSLPNSPMVSAPSDRGQAALIVVNIPANFVTTRCALLVGHVRKVVSDQPLPDGLSAAVTGSAAFGRDYGLAAERSHTRTLYVTLTAVVVILLLVYRAPVAAVIPLGAVSLAAIAAVSLLAAAGHAGFSTGNAERIFLIVLLYGAGVDYSLLLISRCREFLAEGLSPRRATAAGLTASLPAILASAGTDTAGLLTLCFARFRIFQTTGLTVGLALVIALLSAVTLVPALVSLAGAKLYWPGLRASRSRHPGRGIWPRVAVAVTARPGLILIATVALLIVPAVQGTRLTWRYDTLTSLGERYGAVRGSKMVQRHWPVGEMGPVSILFEADRPVGVKEWERASGLITRRLQALPGVENVRSLTQPLGKRPPQSAAKRLFERLFGNPLRRVTRGESRHEYLNRDRTACRFVAVMGKPGLSLEAMALCHEVRAAAASAAKEAGLNTRMHLAGITAEVIDIRDVTHGDFYLIAALVLGVIFVMVLVLLRDVILSAFMVASTILSYLATLGLCFWFFEIFSDTSGLDWKVEVFLFVVMVAVGQDYNIFLAARLAQEASVHPIRPATRRAIIHTGPVISSCGVIMAATLGSLMAGDLVLMVQLGFALALGMLIDTFVVRPLLLPAFVVLTGRTGKGSHVRA